ncbi:retrovirus-related pol polyprotein from transposon TNT 1-94 [Tanacetum coccineum]
MLSGSVFSKQYWNEAVATACYTQNRSTVVKRHLKTPYEIFHGRIPNIDFLHVFGCPFYIHKHKDYIGKFDEKADDGYFLGYSLVSKAFRVFDTRKQQTKETYHITFDESTDAIKFLKPSVDNIYIAESERYPADEYISSLRTSQYFDLKGYSDFDYARCNMDRKSTSGACQLLGGKLVCWSAKKQQYVVVSSAKVEYVVAAGCCANILWMKSQLTDYDIIYEKTLEALTGLLKKVTDTLNRFDSILNAHNKGVPSVGKSTTSLAEGEKNINLTRMDKLTQTEQELKIDFNKPLKEQDPLNELNELANKERKRAGDFSDAPSIVKLKSVQLESLKEKFHSVLGYFRRSKLIFTIVYEACAVAKEDLL